MFDDLTVLQFQKWLDRWGIWHLTAMCYKGLWRVCMYQSDKALGASVGTTSLRLFMSENTSLKKAMNKVRKDVEGNKT